jgi:coenzyme PQQ synthesis protein D (PqqD)
MSLSLDDRVRRTTNAAWQELDGETVLLVSAEAKLLGLNAVAGRIWQLADGTRSLAAIAATLEREFSGGGSAVSDDTLSFADRLVARGLMERCGP